MKRTKFLVMLFAALFFCYGCEEEETGTTIQLSESSFSNISSDGVTLTVTITSHTDWTVSKTAQWCNVTPEKGSGNQTLTIQVEPNLDGASRKATITVAPLPNGTGKRIEITQEAGTTDLKTYHYQLPVIFHVLYQDRSDRTQYVSSVW